VALDAFGMRAIPWPTPALVQAHISLVRKAGKRRGYKPRAACSHGMPSAKSHRRWCSRASRRPEFLIRAATASALYATCFIQFHDVLVPEDNPAFAIKL